MIALHPTCSAMSGYYQINLLKFIIGDVHDKSAPTDVQVILLICIIGPYG